MKEPCKLPEKQVFPGVRVVLRCEGGPMPTLTKWTQPPSGQNCARPGDNRDDRTDQVYDPFDNFPTGSWGLFLRLISTIFAIRTVRVPSIASLPICTVITTI